MPAVPARVCRGACGAGGVVGYPLAQVHEEVAFIAYHYHWSRQEILEMEHADRRQVVEQISAINHRMNEGLTG